MAKPIMLAAGAIPVIVALLIAVPLITKPDIPFFSARVATSFAKVTCELGTAKVNSYDLSTIFRQ